MKNYTTKNVLIPLVYNSKPLNDSKISLDIIKPASHFKIPPWNILKPQIYIDIFSENLKTETSPLVFKLN